MKTLLAILIMLSCAALLTLPDGDDITSTDVRTTLVCAVHGCTLDYAAVIPLERGSEYDRFESAAIREAAPFSGYFVPYDYAEYETRRDTWYCPKCAEFVADRFTVPYHIPESITHGKKQIDAERTSPRQHVVGGAM